VEVLKRRGVSRRRRETRQTFRRFEWSQPGALLDIDAYKAPKFDAPDHRVLDKSYVGRTRGLGHTVVIAVQDDHSRLVYAELHSAENAANVSVALRRGAAWMREQGLGPVEAVLSDNAKCYTGHRFAQTLDELGARHIRIPPYTPRWNGKLERIALARVSAPLLLGRCGAGEDVVAGAPAGRSGSGRRESGCADRSCTARARCGELRGWSGISAIRSRSPIGRGRRCLGGRLGSARARGPRR
jgi:transposase InsO family protein